MVPAYGFTSRCVQNSLLPFSGGCCHRHERKRTSAADWGLSDVAGAGLIAVGSAGDAGADVPGAPCRSTPGGEKLSLLKLYANGFLQRA